MIEIVEKRRRGKVSKQVLSLTGKNCVTPLTKAKLQPGSRNRNSWWQSRKLNSKERGVTKLHKVNVIFGWILFIANMSYTITNKIK